MPQNDEKIILKVGNTNYSGWKDATIKKSMHALAGSFEFSLVDDITFATGSIKAGDPVEIIISDIRGSEQPVMTGFIDSVSRVSTGDSDTVTISGREKTADLVDSIAKKAGNTWKQATMQQILMDIVNPFGIEITFESSPVKIFKKFTIQPDETVHSVIDRLCKITGVVPITNTFGDLVITNSGGLLSNRSTYSLQLGDNIKELEELTNYTNRYSEYTVVGQDISEGGLFSEQTTRISATATDGKLGRYRPLTIVAETKVNTAEAQERANWEAQFRAGDSIKYNVTVLGWFQSIGGALLWEINTITTLIAEKYGILDDFVISELEQSISPEQGRITNILLENPIVFRAKPQKEVKEESTGLFG